MQIKSYARITLALDIIKRLDNGFHELETIKSRINLYDEITIEESNRTIVECDQIKDSIVLKTINVLKEKYNINKDIKVITKKNIPVCGGLAGGSSNAAAVLVALNKLWKLDLPRDELILVAKNIGRDIPFFFFQNLVFDKEVDNGIEEIESFPQIFVVIVNDGTKVLTKDAYSWIDYSKIGLKQASRKIKYLDNKKDLIKYMHNDFEQFVFPRYPNLKKIKEELKSLGLNALMSGSGSTIFGLSFDKYIAENAYNQTKEKYETVILTQTKN